MIAKIGFLNVKIKRFPDVDKTCSQRMDNVIMLPVFSHLLYYNILQHLRDLKLEISLFVSILDYEQLKFRAQLS